jgi:hypothetical protein
MYLDPGFGGMLFQILIAAGAMGGAVLYSLRKKIRQLFSRNKKADLSKTDSTINNSNAANLNDDVIDLINDNSNEGK